jgi:predicted regulator of Ras-like GTPase activity (Roadblock/LC7/MglB family)
MDPVKTVADGVARPSALVPPRPSVAPEGWTAPAVAPGLVTAPPPEPLDPGMVLDGLVGDVSGVRGAILASVDGFGLARSTSMADEAAHPAMLAAAVGLAHQLVALGAGRSLRQLVVDHDGGLLLIWPIGDQRVLAVLAASSVEQRALRVAVQARAVHLAGLTP